ncbi:MAG TPA: alpha/beta fold hydrolase [Rhodothermales bacterium]|nr:alpha/beta fold hydrolase [Rhodothermales bacterium]
MQLEKISFENEGGDALSASLDLPLGGEPRAWAIFAHCFTCSKDLRALRNISNAMNRAGIGVLRFDFTGLGESEGEFAETNFSTNVSDLISAARWLERDRGRVQLLVGHSFGGSAVLKAAELLDDVRAVATIAAPADPDHVAHLFADDYREIEMSGEASVAIAGRTFSVRRQFLEDIRETSMRETLERLRKPVLVLHGPLDNVVGIDNARMIFEPLHHPKSYISLDKADHLLSDPADSRYVGSVISSWASRYLDRWDSEDYPVSGDRVVVGIGEERYRSDIWARGHRCVADEPPSHGGQGLGPTPYDFLIGALGACTTMTLRMYADRKEWPLDSVRVRLRFLRVHASDSGEAEKSSALIDRVEREIEIYGDLDDEQRARLIEIADRCPVHRTLKGDISIVTTEAKIEKNLELN